MVISMSTTEKLYSNRTIYPNNNEPEEKFVFSSYRKTEKTVALITDQNQRVRKDTPLVVEVMNERNPTSVCGGESPQRQ